MNELIKSLVAFQKKVPTIPKNKKNPFFNNSAYADLAIIVEMCMPALNEYDLSISQTFKYEGETNILITKLFHSSGAFLESQILLPKIQDPQKLTAAVTYLRRTSYISILGLVADDDNDGNENHQKQQRPQEQRPVQNNATTQAVAFASEKQKEVLRKNKIEFKDDITQKQASDLIASMYKR